MARAGRPPRADVAVAARPGAERRLGPVPARRASGLVGAALGTIFGLAITIHLNEIEQFIGRLTGEEMFPRDVYYFDKIPTNIQAWMVTLVNIGAVAIAVVFSVVPALRAALLHPVQALRYE